MRTFTRVAGSPTIRPPAYITDAIDAAERESLQTPSLNEHLQLEGRVYTLEKEMQMVSNILLIGIMVGGYFAYRWYFQYINSIPGVVS